MLSKLFVICHLSDAEKSILNVMQILPYASNFSRAVEAFGRLNA